MSSRSTLYNRFDAPLVPQRPSARLLSKLHSSDGDLLIAVRIGRFIAHFLLTDHSFILKQRNMILR